MNTRIAFQRRVCLLSLVMDGKYGPGPNFDRGLAERLQQEFPSVFAQLIEKQAELKPSPALA